jgi:hypothetical protein
MFQTSTVHTALPRIKGKAGSKYSRKTLSQNCRTG